ncbi:type 1 glutamine amidotransferase domain-containing protein [Pseudomonas sp. Gutcm_11s]|uniref:type 1 glutamine amidotransferase domain-containing protein n=1 Tax=Pseudomonas sp. Gutcm_11s TaxID=3026088 RepID=UPI00235FA235|nr:type 1 glutamine amidotransferase domain-containing protein [Pseudomonas sp. Gutcm_11s]MDD0841603.1 type 1 glutamine amidotransferase domain-containing protein [Pseudomonas sp. Gutcm_11s]
MPSLAKIALATALAAASLGAQAANVLVVLSDADHLDLKDGKVYPTGFFLNELMQPTKLLLDAGHSVTFATPNGLAPTMDVTSDNAQYFGGDAANLAEHKALLEKLRLTQADASPVISLARVEQIGYPHFDALYVPGGHAPMQDLLRSPQLGKLLRAFHAEGKTTALVCHGPIALLSALPDAAGYVQRLERDNTAKAGQEWIYSGYRMTVISNQEEEQAKQALNGGAMKFYPQTGLQQAGGSYSSNTSPWTPHMVVDRELITGQNPASAQQVGEELLRRLK